MTADALTAIVSRTRNLFLDFDGPICSIFAGYPAPTVAAELRTFLAQQGVSLTEAMEGTADPIEVLRLVGDQGDETVTRLVADALRDAEVTAAGNAQPTPQADDVIAAALETGRRLAVISNNSVEAVTTYLREHGLLSSFIRVVGRYDGMPVELLKPSNHLLGLALIGTDSAPWSTTLVGDSTTDIEAARSVPMASIGYANKPGKATALAEAGADTVITTMAELAQVLTTTPVVTTPRPNS